MTLLHLVKSLSEETLALYHTLAESVVPLNEDDRSLVKMLADLCLFDDQPTRIPMRETRAIINSVDIVNLKIILLSFLY